MKTTLTRRERADVYRLLDLDFLSELANPDVAAWHECLSEGLLQIGSLLFIGRTLTDRQVRNWRGVSLERWLRLAPDFWAMESSRRPKPRERVE